MMSLRFMTSFVLLLALIKLKASSRRSYCSIEAQPNEGKYWVLEVHIDQFDVETIDVVVYKLARQNGFRILWRYNGMFSLYVLEFRQTVLEEIRAENSGSETEICRLQKKAIIDGMTRIRETPGVWRFDRSSAEIRLASANGESHEILVINRPVGSNQENDEEKLANLKVRFVELTYKIELSCAHMGDSSTKPNPNPKQDSKDSKASTEENNKCKPLQSQLEITVNSDKSQYEFAE